MMNIEPVAVGVAGASGYAGAELLRILGSHPVFEVAVVAGGATARRSLAEVFPHLRCDRILAEATAESFAGCDVVFLATPHELSLELAPALVDRGARVVDLSGAFRLAPDVFEQWYGLRHRAPALAPAAYGLPELFGGPIAGALLVANPGCYPTAALLALAPLRDLVEPDSVTIVGMSGTSGAGKGLREELHFSHAAANLTAYGAPLHRHTPEIEAGWERLTGTAASVTFTPHLVPTPRGLLCTATATLLPGVHPAEVRRALEKTYAGEAFVAVAGEGTWPSTTHLRGSNGATVGSAVDPRTGRVTASCAIDNLGKGAAGQAVQNANLLLGLPPAAGLSDVGVYP